MVKRAIIYTCEKNKTSYSHAQDNRLIKHQIERSSNRNTTAHSIDNRSEIFMVAYLAQDH